MRRRLLRLAFALTLVAAPAVAQDDRALEAVRPVYDALKQTERELSKMPRPQNDGEILIRLGRLDEAPRAAIAAIDLAKLSPSERERVRQLINLRLQPIDAANLDMLQKLLPDEGWYSSKVYGPDAAAAALRILSHQPAPYRQRFLPAIQAMAAKGEADPALVAKLTAR